MVDSIKVFTKLILDTLNSQFLVVNRLLAGSYLELV